MKKQSLGLKFQKEFLFKRELPTELVKNISKFLEKYKIPFTLTRVDNDNGLCSQFFKEGYFLRLYPDKDTSPLIIGKGVTFDTGGYNIKDCYCHIEEMWYDKNGAILALAASLDLKVPSLVFFVFNGLSILPGSIITDPYSKLKVYIQDTDAEGRIGLADCLSRNNNFDKAITIATLTGAAQAMMGTRVGAVVHSTSREIAKQIIDAPFEDLWPGPINKEYNKAIESKIKGSDITNLASKSSLRGAGSQTAYAFLKRFFKGNLLHFDIAPMSTDKNGNPLVWGLKQIKYCYKLLKNAA